jgi:hypothetical protein
VRSLHFRTLDWHRLDLILKDPTRITFEDVSEQESLVPMDPAVPFPVFGGPQLSSYKIETNSTHVGFYASHIIVDENADASEVVGACLAMRAAQLGSPKADNLSKVAANSLQSYEPLVDALQRAGWQLEMSRALLGDARETRVCFH